MTHELFIHVCNERLIDPELALENDDLAALILQDASAQTIINFIDTNF